ncbi:integrating conjugative element protein (TIGR03761 family) [Corticibacter populi]|nr:integrating conjugative element protein (TIGR03761 family) [Corticibacter populi]
MANEPLQLNLGSLRSAMTLTLHTHHASRIWHGRAPAEGRPGIIGLNGFIGNMNKMKRGSEQDDPYSDWWMLRVEEKLEQTKATLQTLREQVDQALADVPPALSLGENLNVQPVKLPLFVNAQLGFMAVYLLADYDDLARKLILAHHTALIDRGTLERWLNDGAHALRSLFSLAQQYRYSGCTRDDFAAKNAAAHAALEKFGELPQDVLEGARRSRFAPPVLRRSPLSATPRTPTEARASALAEPADEVGGGASVDTPVDASAEASSDLPAEDPARPDKPRRSRKSTKAAESADGDEPA